MLGPIRTFSASFHDCYSANDRCSTAIHDCRPENPNARLISRLFGDKSQMLYSIRHCCWANAKCSRAFMIVVRQIPNAVPLSRLLCEKAGCFTAFAKVIDQKQDAVHHSPLLS